MWLGYGYREKSPKSLTSEILHCAKNRKFNRTTPSYGSPIYHVPTIEAKKIIEWALSQFVIRGKTRTRFTPRVGSADQARPLVLSRC